jgi:signal transduction histidine kinase
VSVLQRLRTTRLDAGLAVLLTVAGLVQSWFVPLAAPGIAAVYVVGSTLPLAWRRTHPVEAAAASAAFWLVPLEGYPVLGFVAVVLQFFSLGSLGRPGRAVAVVTALAAVTSVVGTLLGPEPPVAAVGALLVVLAPVLAGRLVRRQRHQNEVLAALTLELRDERRRAEEAAVGGERARIAQELHDVVGHDLTLIAILAEAATMALAASPGQAAVPVEAIRSTAHQALSEIRGVLEVLAPKSEVDRDPAEGLVALTERARSSGVPNTLSVSGRPGPTQSTLALAVHRIVRECLTNAGRHASGSPVSVTVRWAADEVVVQAVNDADGLGRVRAGRGLTGIRHRAELLGGDCRVDATDGQFSVRVSIPRSMEGARS